MYRLVKLHKKLKSVATPSGQEMTAGLLAFSVYHGLGCNSHSRGGGSCIQWWHHVKIALVWWWLFNWTFHGFQDLQSPIECSSMSPFSICPLLFGHHAVTATPPAGCNLDRILHPVQVRGQELDLDTGICSSFGHQLHGPCWDRLELLSGLSTTAN